jgi:hypothetical protein
MLDDTSASRRHHHRSYLDSFCASTAIAGEMIFRPLRTGTAAESERPRYCGVGPLALTCLFRAAHVTLLPQDAVACDVQRSRWAATIESWRIQRSRRVDVGRGVSCAATSAPWSPKMPVGTSLAVIGLVDASWDVCRSGS